MEPVLSVVEGTPQFQPVIFIHRAAYLKLSGHYQFCLTSASLSIYSI